MLYVQQFQHTRYPQLQEYQRLRSTSDQNFLLCSNQYAEKISQVSRPSRPSSTVNTGQERNGTLFVLTRIQSLVALHKRQTHDSSILNIVSIAQSIETIVVNNSTFLSSIPCV